MLIKDVSLETGLNGELTDAALATIGVKIDSSIAIVLDFSGVSASVYYLDGGTAKCISSGIKWTEEVVAAIDNFLEWK